MGFFDNIGNAVIGQGGTYLKPGHRYLVEVVKCLTKQGRKGDLFFIAELLVHESSDQTLPPGFTASWTCNFKHDAAIGNVLWFLGAVNGIDVKDEARLKREITSQVAEFAVSLANPLAGRMVEVEVQAVKTRAGGDFSKHVWHPTTLPPNEAARSAARAKAAAAPPPPPLSGLAAPAFAPPPALPPAFPPPGWAAHPSAPGYYYQGTEVLSEAQLRAKVAPPPPAPPAPPPAPTAPAPWAPPSSLFGGAPPAFGAPGLPPPPPAAPLAPPAPKPFPPPGWAAHPSAPGYYYQGTEVLSEAQLRAKVAPPPPAPPAPPAPAPWAPPPAPTAPTAPAPTAPAPWAPPSSLFGGAPPAFGAPGLPPPPPAAPLAPPAPKPFPPPGWAAHPSAPGYFYQGTEVLSEAQLRAR